MHLNYEKPCSSLGFSISLLVLDLLISKFNISGGKKKAVEYDNFIEYVLICLKLIKNALLVLTSSSVCFVQMLPCCEGIAFFFFDKMSGVM